MMLSVREVSIALLVIWFFFYTLLKARTLTSKIYYVLLLVMASAGLFFNDLPLMGLYPRVFNFGYILLFALLMIIVLIPWYGFDAFYRYNNRFTVNPRYIGLLKPVFVITILVSFYSIIYAIPYARNSIIQGALEVRQTLSSESPLPPTLFTTLAVGFASFSPVAILFAFISLMDQRLRKYSLWLVLASLSYIFTSLAICAREGFIYTPLTYIMMYIVFRNSLDQSIRVKIKKGAILIAPVMIILFAVLSFSRFFDNGYSSPQDSLYGTWGYLYQQPYVFDHVLSSFKRFFGFNRRLMFMNSIIPLPGRDYSADATIEYMFGTQFAEFYEINGYESLIIITLIYVALFGFTIRYLARKRKVFPLLLAFLIYYYFTISGLFYFRFAGNNSEFLFYFAIFISSFFVPNILLLNSNSK